MILRIADKNDQSSNDVIDWLLHYNTKFYRLNGGDKIAQKNFVTSNILHMFNMKPNSMFLQTIVIGVSMCAARPIPAQTPCDCFERLMNLGDYFCHLDTGYEELEIILPLIKKYNNESDYTFQDFRNLAYFNLKLNRMDEATLNYLKAIERGYTWKDDYIEEKLPERFGESCWKKIELKSDSLYRIFKSKLNLEYYADFRELRGFDQAIRRLGDENLMRNLSNVDSMTMQYLSDLINHYGFPNVAKDGFDGSYFDFFFLHTSMFHDYSYFEKSIDLLENAASACLQRKYFIGTVTDRRRVYIEKKAQLYGVWNFWQDKGRFSPIENVETVDERRFELNMLRLSEYGKSSKRTLPEGYVKLPYPENYFCGYKFKE